MLKPEETPGLAVAFFGHSMGSLLAFELALRFRAARQPDRGAVRVGVARAGVVARVADVRGSDHQLLAWANRVTGVNPVPQRDEQFAAAILPPCAP